MFENLSASYDVGIAKKYGLNCAVLLNKLMYLSKYTIREDGFCWRTAKELEDELGLSPFQQKKAIEILENNKIIETKNTYIINTQIKCKHFKVLLENYKSDYEETNKSIESKETNKSDFKETNKSIYNNNTNNNINNNNIIQKKYFDDLELNTLFIEFLDLRKKLKCKNTDRAINLLLNELNKYDDNTKIEMINNSIMNSWKSVYPIKEIKQNKNDKFAGINQAIEEVYNGTVIL